jgi:ribosomal protein L40E
VSHSKERKEKVCLNCGAQLEGRYCHICGQENLEPKETVWGLVSHFFNDITHFDGKFFSTAKYLVLKPGFLSSEYLKGRRASYLHPIRMYVFTSAFFFIIFFSVFNPSGLIKGEKSKEEQIKEFTEAREGLKDIQQTTKDSVLEAAIERTIVKIDHRLVVLQQQTALQRQKDSLKLLKNSFSFDTAAGISENMDALSAKIAADVKKAQARKKIDTNKNDSANNLNTRIGFSDDFKFNSQIAYDSVQNELPEKRRDGWLKKSIIHRAIALNIRLKSDKKEAISLLLEKFMHTLPQALFISLPFFALLLLMLYARRTRFYYVDHGIFSIHLYCATFVMLLAYFAVDKIKTAVGWEWLDIVKGLLVVAIFFYLYKAMRNFYQQGRIKTIAKFLILTISSLFVFILITGLFFMLSFLQFS